MTTKEMKLRAKNALKYGSFGTGYGLNIAYYFINSLASAILGIFFTFGMTGSMMKLIFEILAYSNQMTYSIENAILILEKLLNQLKLFVVMSLIMSVIMVVIKILFLNVLNTGKVLWFSRNREQAEPARFSFLFEGLKKGKYGDLVKGTAWRDFWLFIWQLPIFLFGAVLTIISFSTIDKLYEILLKNYGSYRIELRVIDEIGFSLDTMTIVVVLLFLVYIVFGIITMIKSYSYRATDWILADNPNIGHRRALNLSKAMTKGYKSKWFVLDLSFIGWGLLLILTFPVIFFTAPVLETYMKATYAEFYAMIRNDAVNKGLVTMEELGFISVQQSYQEPVSATDFYQPSQQNPMY